MTPVIITYRTLPESEIVGRSAFVVVSSESPDFEIGETLTDEDISMAGSTGTFVFVESE